MALQSVGRKKYTKRKIGPTQGANVQVEQAALDTLIKAINSLPIKLGDKATIQGMKRAMRPAKRMAKQLAPKDSGFLKRQITIEKGKYTRNKAAVTINPYVVLGVKNKKVGKKNAKKYLHFVLLGTKAGVRKTYKKNYFVISGSNRKGYNKVLVQKIKHTGSRGVNFFTETWNRTKNTCHKRMLPEIVKRIQEVKTKAGIL
jgi:hypothetical protein|tara:strand:+ start:636 stop:1238 length:603 start_codon:yes stop_codon:yes gene_type:complete